MPNLRVSLSRLHFPITTLGPGQRIGVWMQGCSIHCVGCMSRDTWKFAKGDPVENAIRQMEGWFGEADGITISGGEPFDQADALMALLEEVRAHFAGDILVYSGYAFETLQGKYSEILANIDVLISEPYQAECATHLPLRGSDNQIIHLLTPLGATRFADIASAKTSNNNAALDVVIDANGDMWIAGVPRPGDLERLDRRLAQQGLRLATSAGRMGSAH